MLELNKENFDKEVLESDKPVVIDFWAPWCGPCKAIAPKFKQLGEEFQNVKVAKVDIDTDSGQEIAAKYGIRAIPTFVVVFPNKKDQPELLVGPSYDKLRKLFDSLSVRTNE